MKKTQQQLANEAEIDKLRKKYEIACAIATPAGFYKTWFNSLPNYKNGADAFHALNELHYNTVEPPSYKYSSYESFLAVNRRRKKNGY